MRKTYKTFFLGFCLALMSVVPQCGRCDSAPNANGGQGIVINIGGNGGGMAQQGGQGGGQQNQVQYNSQKIDTTLAGTNASNGCDDESNDRIIAELALCSTHAYNIGQDTNNINATDKQLMRDVVALKTTVITQQMDKQYEYMEATLRRFKTQLEKAILTTKLQAAGATTTAGSAGGSSSGASVGVGANRMTNVSLDGAQNCAEDLVNQSDFINCLSSNYKLISQATNFGQTTSNEARKQLVTDFGLVNKYGRLNNEMQPRKNNAYDKKCENSNMNRTVLQECLAAHASNIGTMQQNYDKSNRQPNK